MFLPFFVVYAFVRAILTVPRSGHIKLIHLSDALLAPLGLALKALLRVPVVVTVPGLDVTYDNRLYQWAIPKCLKRMDKIICVSSYTRTQCIKRGMPAALCDVIPNGVNMLEFDDQFTPAGMRNLQMHAGRMIRDRKVLLTGGRLLERKGVVDFLTEVLPRPLAQGQGMTHVLSGEGQRSDLAEHTTGTA